MNRYKFRAINTKTNYWFDESELIYNNGKWYQDWRSFEDGQYLNMDDCVVMQYSGVIDMNGIEICEGDIARVKTQVKDNGDFPIGYVVRDTNKPEMFIALIEQYKETGKRQYHLENLYRHYSDELEIIGSIYDDPELLEVTA